VERRCHEAAGEHLRLDSVSDIGRVLYEKLKQPTDGIKRLQNNSFSTAEEVRKRRDRDQGGRKGGEGEGGKERRREGGEGRREGGRLM
jgi:hypothetical protein